MISKSLNKLDAHPEADFNSHCPWINNCVGNNNLRHFLLYLLLMEIGVILFIRLVLACETPFPEGTAVLSCHAPYIDRS